ncbi:PH domain-containing protein [Corynebacterium sp. zg254]|uniref:PH domain-containing protein n=1 Tax=Corynebacterium zhongnanshanii TaxID=2768834 RepID=A0ABQ6VCR1_9CORY|nr:MULTISPECIES: PH domain-containing protein [Corynebacterium]KAB3520012.1 PH domain-containing protein [Corynebacterium zhongnanshanii]MCR5914745.1 PH domain-containing protein [Corynebacterium sp. zg254]
MHPVSPKLVPVRYVTHLSFWAVLILAETAAGFFGHPWFYVGTAVLLAIFVWLLWLIPAQVRNMGWLETDDELLITTGKLWHTFTVVPYGRIQFVDVTSGPVERLWGLKTVQLHTASAGTDAKVKGLPAKEADALRERLTVQARERMSGL